MLKAHPSFQQALAFFDFLFWLNKKKYTYFLGLDKKGPENKK